MSEQDASGSILYGSSEHGGRQDTFYHPIKKTNIEFFPMLSGEEKLRLITQSSTISREFERRWFTSLFPDSLKPATFNKESVGHPDETRLTPDEKMVRRSLLKYFGWASRKDQISPKNIEGLLVRYTDEPGTLTSMLLDLDDVKRTRDIAQTEPRYMIQREPKHRTNSLSDHSEHVALWTARTHMRFPLNNHTLYLERIRKDLAEFELQYEKRHGIKRTFTFAPTPEVYEVVDRALEGKSIPDNKKTDPSYREALAIGVEYQKYLTIYAFLHDVESPAWKDVYMKTQARVPGQKSADFSEDDALIRATDEYITYQLREIIKKHKLDPELLRIIIESLASENSPTLGGYLIKDKRRGLSERPEFDFIPSGQAYDHDQESGTMTNAEDLIAELFPGGFVHVTKHFSPPIGSFEERARLVAYMLTTGLTKEQLRGMLEKMNIDPRRVYIASEEIAVGPNVALREYKGIHKDGTPATEILPVALVPGDVKRAMTMFAILYMWRYVGERRVPMETATQDAIAFGLHDKTISPYMFLRHKDYDTARILNDSSPVLSWFHVDPEINDGVQVLSAEELLRKANDRGEIPGMLVCKVDQYPEIIFPKDGTLVVDDNGDIKSYLDVIQQKRQVRLAGNTDIHPQSLRARFEAVQAARKGPWFYVIPLSDEKQQGLFGLLGAENDPMRKMFRLWTEPVEIQGKTVTFPVRSTLLSPTP